MTKSIDIDLAQARLREIVAELAPGEEIVLVRNRRPLAKLVAAESTPRRRQPGNCVGMLSIVSDDDDHLKDFEEYMQ